MREKLYPVPMLNLESEHAFIQPKISRPSMEEITSQLYPVKLHYLNCRTRQNNINSSFSNQLRWVFWQFNRLALSSQLPVKFQISVYIIDEIIKSVSDRTTGRLPEQPDTVFETIKLYCEEILVALLDEGRPLKSKQAILKDLLTDFYVCGPGIYRKIANTHALCYGGKGLAYWLASFRTVLVDQLAEAHIQRKKISDGNATHVNNVLYQYAYDNNWHILIKPGGLNEIFASLAEMSPGDLVKIHTLFKERYAKEAVSEIVQYLRNDLQKLIEYYSNDANGVSIEDERYPDFCQALESLLREVGLERLSLHTILILDDESETFSFNPNFMNNLKGLVAYGLSRLGLVVDTADIVIGNSHTVDSTFMDELSKVVMQGLEYFGFAGDNSEVTQENKKTTVKGFRQSALKILWIQEQELDDHIESTLLEKSYQDKQVLDGHLLDQETYIEEVVAQSDDELLQEIIVELERYPNPELEEVFIAALTSVRTINDPILKFAMYKLPKEAWHDADCMDVRNRLLVNAISELITNLRENPDNLHTIDLLYQLTQFSSIDVWADVYRSVDYAENSSPLLILAVALTENPDNQTLIALIEALALHLPGEAWSQPQQTGSFRDTTPLMHIIDALVKDPTNPNLIALIHSIIEFVSPEAWRQIQQVGPFKNESSLINLMALLIKTPLNDLYIDSVNTDLIPLINKIADYAAKELWWQTEQQGQFKNKVPLKYLFQALHSDPTNTDLIALVDKVTAYGPKELWEVKHQDYRGEISLMYMTNALLKTPRNTALIALIDKVSDTALNVAWTEEQKRCHSHIISALIEAPNQPELIALFKKILSQSMNQTWSYARKNYITLMKLMDALVCNTTNPDLLSLFEIAAIHVPNMAWGHTTGAGDLPPLLYLMNILLKYPNYIGYPVLVNKVADYVPKVAWSQAREGDSFSVAMSPFMYLTAFLAKKPSHTILLALFHKIAAFIPKQTWSQVQEAGRFIGETPLGHLMGALVEKPTNKHLIALIHKIIEYTPRLSWSQIQKVGLFKGETPLMYLMEALVKNPSQPDLISLFDKIVAHTGRAAWEKPQENGFFKGSTPIMRLVIHLNQGDDNNQIIALIDRLIGYVPKEAWGQLQTIGLFQGETPVTYLMAALAKYSKNIPLFNLIDKIRKAVPQLAWERIEGASFFQDESPLMNMEEIFQSDAHRTDLMGLRDTNLTITLEDLTGRKKIIVFNTNRTLSELLKDIISNFLRGWDYHKFNILCEGRTLIYSNDLLDCTLYEHLSMYHPDIILEKRNHIDFAIGFLLGRTLASRKDIHILPLTMRYKYSDCSELICPITLDTIYNPVKINNHFYECNAFAKFLYESIHARNNLHAPFHSIANMVDPYRIPLGEEFSKSFLSYMSDVNLIEDSGIIHSFLISIRPKETVKSYVTFFHQVVNDLNNKEHVRRKKELQRVMKEMKHLAYEDLMLLEAENELKNITSFDLKKHRDLLSMLESKRKGSMNIRNLSLIDLKEMAHKNQHLLNLGESARNLIMKFSCLNEIQRHIVFLILKKFLLMTVNTPKDIRDVFFYLTDDERTNVFEEFANDLSAMIRNGHDIRLALEHSNQSIREIVFNIKKDYFYLMINSAEELRDTLFYFNAQQRMTILETLRGRLAILFTHTYGLFCVLQHLSKAQCIIISESIQWCMPIMIKSAIDLDRVLPYLDENNRSFVISAIEWRLAEMVTSSSEFCIVFKYVDQTKHKIGYKSLQKKLFTIITNIYEFKAAFRDLNREKRIEFFVQLGRKNLNSILSKVSRYYLYQYRIELLEAYKCIRSNEEKKYFCPVFKFFQHSKKDKLRVASEVINGDFSDPAAHQGLLGKIVAATH